MTPNSLTKTHSTRARRDRDSSHPGAKLALVLIGAIVMHGASALTCITDTTQAEFAQGVAQNTDFDSQPGDIVLAQPTPGVFATSGTYVSSVKDASPAPGEVPSWPTLSWTSTTPGTTDVRFQVAAADSASGPFDFVGPTGTATSYFVSPGASLRQFSGKRYLRYKAIFTTGDTAMSATLRDVTACALNGSPPDLALSMSANRTRVQPGQETTFTLTVNNLGPIDAVGERLSLKLPPETRFVSTGSTAGWSCLPTQNAESTCTLALNPVSPGTPVTAQINLDLGPRIFENRFELTTTARVIAGATTGSDPNATNDEASVILPIDAAPDLLVTIDDHGQSTAAGQSVTYLIFYYNVGTRGATGVRLQATVPAHTTFNPGASQATWLCAPDFRSGSVCEIDVGTLNAAMGERAANFAVVVDADANESLSPIEATVRISDDGLNGVEIQPSDNIATDTTPILPTADLKVTAMASPTSAIAGDTLDYAITISNLGPSAARTMRWTTDLPPGTVFDAISEAAGWTCTLPAVGEAGTVTCRNTSFAVATQTFALRVRVDRTLTEANVLPLRVSAFTQSFDGNTVNNTYALSTPVVTRADLGVTLTDTPDPARAGRNLTYTITLANAGPSLARTARWSGSLPTGTRFVALDAPAGWACATPAPGGIGTITCELATLDPRAVVFGLTTRVDDQLPSGTVLHNVVSVSSGTTDPRGEDNLATTTTTINGPPTIIAPPAVSVLEDQASAPLSLHIADALTPPFALKLFLTSSDENLVTNAGLAAGLSGSESDYTLVVRPRADAFGAGTIIASAVDVDNLLAQQPIALQVVPVNDPPRATFGGNRLHPAGSAGTQVVNQYANDIAAGPANEAAQTFGFSLIETRDGNGVVSASSIDTAGTLRYSLSGAEGSATLRALIFDNGGVANGGINQSAPQLFKIIVGDGVDLSTRITRQQPSFLPLASEANGGATLASYDVIVTHHGAQPINDVQLQAQALSGLTQVLWSCNTTTGPCSPASGTGTASTHFALNVGDTATLRVSGTIQRLESQLHLVANATLPQGTTNYDAVDDSAEVIEPIVEAATFEDGFE